MSTGTAITLFLSISIMAYIVLFFAFKAFSKKEQLTYQQRKTMERYNGQLPRAGKVNHYILALIIFMAIAYTGKSQVFAELGAGMTNKYFSAELQVGYRYNNLIASAGFISIPNNTQPVLLNIRAGVVMQERVIIYAGYVRNQMSTDFKWLNKNAWQVGAQYHMCHFDKGTVYIGANYTSGNYFSGHIGMSYNLLKGFD